MMPKLPPPGYRTVTVRPAEYDARNLPAWFRVTVLVPIGAPDPSPFDTSLIRPPSARRTRTNRATR